MPVSDAAGLVPPIDTVDRARLNVLLSGSDHGEACAAVMELDPKYSDVIVRRYEAYTHREAQLLDDGRTFSAIATERALRAA